MTCLTTEQLVAVALETDDANHPMHVEECPACRHKLGELRRLSDNLAAAHASLERDHAKSRDRMLTRLIEPARTTPPTTAWKSFAFGGLGISSAIAVLLLLAIFINSSAPLSAMERIAKAVRDVSSFSYRLSDDSEFPSQGDKPARTLAGKSFACWRAPAASAQDQFGDFRATQSHKWVQHLSTGDQAPDLTLDIVEIHPSGKPGILIDFVRRQCFRVPPLRARDITNSTPLLWLQAVRNKEGRIVKDLGSRQIISRNANGCRMKFDNISSFHDFGPVDVWIDPQTDLPVEFCFQHATNTEGVVNQFSVTDIQWNIDFDPKLFDTTPPAGFLDVTLPQDDRSIAEIVTALRLYAELSGGKYPHVEKLDDRAYTTKFDAAACHRDMLQLAGFTGPIKDSWADDPQYQRIQQSRAGLDTLERVFHNPNWLIGYNGSDIVAGDKQKLLLWWNVARENTKSEYRSFYGDLRTEVVPREKWINFVSQETADMTE